MLTANALETTLIDSIRFESMPGWLYHRRVLILRIPIYSHMAILKFLFFRFFIQYVHSSMLLYLRRMRNRIGLVKPYRCSHGDCTKSYNRIDNLRLHEHTHKSDESDEIDTDIELSIASRTRPMSDQMVLKNIENLKRKRPAQRITRKVGKL